MHIYMIQACSEIGEAIWLVFGGHTQEGRLIGTPSESEHSPSLPRTSLPRSDLVISVHLKSRPLISDSRINRVIRIGRTKC
ncbi:hypothetical protein MPTK1_4g15310 [Marchantia polymorpha subsp. ruderalis]|uniref:Uncharacterized protein n=2 Tax=Marchantia polymorpha TaxID=3197 RepID=A0AAF6BA57_MARPO|nr:hypothetical protein MARPO_0119s0055 [Marchantia polymorpha]BBN08891.1 hypothetical protein Mp_4g15310 [Marchantia polymorpha subsp. ruderalis]|eukprot:PTQ30857.1 hypothetical protein MARPO_0119s0055 [Marchantia polymorpha]